MRVLRVLVPVLLVTGLAACRGSRLVQASYDGDLGAVKQLLAEGVNVNSANRFHTTALMAAAGVANAPVVGLLLANGADVNRRDAKGETALLLAVQYGSTSDAEGVAGALIARGADLKVKGPRGRTLLMLAAENGLGSVVRLLLAGGADPSARDDGGSTPIMRAAAAGSIGTMGLLAAAGADINARDSSGATALHYAAYNDQGMAIMIMLDQFKANPEIKDNNGVFPEGEARGLNKNNAIWAFDTHRRTELYRPFTFSMPQFSLPKPILIAPRKEK